MIRYLRESATAGLEGGAVRYPSSVRGGAVGAVIALLAAPNLAGQVRQITVKGTEYGFEAPDTVDAGVARVRFSSAGEELHHAQLVRLEDGKTIDDLKAWIRESGAEMLVGDPPSWLTWVGGPGAVPAGDESNATVALRAGTHAWLCLVTTRPPERAHHFMKGMLRGMTVIGNQRPRLPPSDALLILSDYDFELSRPLTAGFQTITVRSKAGQRHEVALARLHPGKTMDDLLAWLSASPAPMPVDVVGGISVLDSGEANLLELDLTAGDYVMLCFVPDSGDGRPHYQHGMIKGITVR